MFLEELFPQHLRSGVTATRPEVARDDTVVFEQLSRARDVFFGAPSDVVEGGTLDDATGCILFVLVLLGPFGGEFPLHASRFPQHRRQGRDAADAGGWGEGWGGTGRKSSCTGPNVTVAPGEVSTGF